MKSRTLLTVCWIALVILPLQGCLRLPRAQRQAPKIVITLAEYQQITQGMNLQEAEKIVGAPAVQKDGYCTWQNSNMSGAFVWFENNKSIRKARFGELQ